MQPPDFTQHSIMNKEVVNAPKPSFGTSVKRRNEENKIASPGPGSYNSETMTLLDSKEASAFKSGSKRFLASKVVENPSPGHYETDIQGIKREMVKSMSKASANFKPPLHAKRVKVNLYDPFSNIDRDDEWVGPGSYVNTSGTIQKKVNEKLKFGKSSMFAPTSNLDKFGRTRYNSQTSIPGPGHYDDALQLAQMRAMPMSAFKSTAKKNQFYPKIKNPGPAFYKLQNSFSRETLNVNPKKDWL